MWYGESQPPTSLSLSADLALHLGILKGGISFLKNKKEKEFLPALRMRNIITLKGVRSLYDSTMDDLKWKN